VKRSGVGLLNCSRLLRAAFFLFVLLIAGHATTGAGSIGDQLKLPSKGGVTLQPEVSTKRENLRLHSAGMLPIVSDVTNLTIILPVGEASTAQHSWSFVATKAATQSPIDYQTSTSLPEHLSLTTLNFSVTQSSSCAQRMLPSESCYGAMAVLEVESDPGIEEGSYNVQVLYDLVYYPTCCVPFPEGVPLQTLNLILTVEVIPSPAPYETLIQLNVNPPRASLGEVVRVDGKLYVMRSQTVLYPLAAATVSLEYIPLDSLPVTRYVRVENGSFTDNFSPNREGTWHLLASWKGDMSRETASGDATFLVSDSANTNELILMGGALSLVVLVLLLTLGRFRLRKPIRK
jgi:hypothetical protein